MALVKKKLVCIICLHRFDSKNKESIPIPHENLSCQVLNATPTNLQQDEKEESTCNESTGTRSTNIYERFLQFVSQYFKLRNFTGRFIACAKEAKNEDGGPAKLETFCESCGELVSEICGLYKQLRTAQLFLVWKLGQVGELMRKGAVPGGPKSHRQAAKVKYGLANVAMMKQMNVDAARPVGAFRKALQLKCINAPRKSLPDVVVYKGLFPDQWRFMYSATKQTLIRLITVFILASSQIIKSSTIKPSIIPNDEKQVEQLGSRRSCRKSRKRVKFSPPPMTVKNELVGDSDYMADDFGNGSDSDWSQGAASPMSVDSNASLTKKTKKPEPCGETRIDFKSRRNVVVQAEEDGNSSTSNSQDSDDEENHKPKKRIRRQYIPESEKTIKCPQCPKLVVDRRGLARHLQMVHRSYILCFCKHCGMRFRNQVEQVRHHREMHKGKVKRGRHVRRIPIPSTKRARPKRKRRVPPSTTAKGGHRGSPPILSVCPKCSQVFPKKQMKYHLSRVHKLGTAKHECPYCFQRLVGERRFKVHMASHENKTITEFIDHWYCQVCGQHHNSKDSLKAHMKESHQDNYVCAVCNEELETGKVLRDHLLLNHETEKEKLFQCRLCRASFTTQQFYDIHRALAHKDKRKFACDLKKCCYIFDTIVEMSEHLKIHLNLESNPDLRIFRCKTCEMGFLKKYSLKLHQLLHTSESSAPGGKGYDCPKCNKNINCKESLVVHYKFVHGDEYKKVKRYQCPLCQKWFTKKAWFETHVRLHNVPILEGNVICEICDVRCVDNIALSLHRHRQGHGQQEEDPTPTKPIKEENEDEGSEAVVMEGLLKMKKGIMEEILKKSEMDRRRFDPASPPPSTGNESEEENKTTDDLEEESLPKLSCELENCGETFESAYLLRKHLENEHEAGIPEVEKNIQCYFCHQRFCYQQSHEIHERAHHKTEISRKYKCELKRCRKRKPFILMEDLHKHLQTHIGDPDTSFARISFCRKCNWGFLTPESIDLHELIHDSPGATQDSHVENKRTQFNRDSLTCDEPNCGKIFKNKTRLTFHKNSEHLSKDWICDLCGFAVSMEYKLKNHMRTHAEPRFACDECGQMFTRQQGLDVHKDYKHNPNRKQNVICSACGKSFFSRTGLMHHFESTHKPESEWRLKCPRCPKRFYRRMFLNVHLKKCDGKVVEQVEGVGASSGSARTTNGLRRRSARERKKKRNCSDDEDEMTDKSTTDEEEDKHEIKLSTVSQQVAPQNEFQDLLRLPGQQPLVSHQLQHDPQKIITGSSSSMATAATTATNNILRPDQQHPQMQFHHPFVNQESEQPCVAYQSPTSS